MVLASFSSLNQFRGFKLKKNSRKSKQPPTVGQIQSDILANLTFNNKNLIKKILNPFEAVEFRLTI